MITKGNKEIYFYGVEWRVEDTETALTKNGLKKSGRLLRFRNKAGQKSWLWERTRSNVENRRVSVTLRDIMVFYGKRWPRYVEDAPNYYN